MLVYNQVIRCTLTIAELPKRQAQVRVWVVIVLPWARFKPGREHLQGTLLELGELVGGNQAKCDPTVRNPDTSNPLSQSR